MTEHGVRNSGSQGHGATDVLSSTRSAHEVPAPIFSTHSPVAPGGELRLERTIAETGSEKPAALAASATHTLPLPHRLVVIVQPRDVIGDDASRDQYDGSEQRTTRDTNETFWFLYDLIGEDFADSLCAYKLIDISKHYVQTTRGYPATRRQRLRPRRRRRLDEDRAAEPTTLSLATRTMIILNQTLHGAGVPFLIVVNLCLFALCVKNMMPGGGGGGSWGGRRNIGGNLWQPLSWSPEIER